MIWGLLDQDETRVPSSSEWRLFVSTMMPGVVARASDCRRDPRTNVGRPDAQRGQDAHEMQRRPDWAGAGPAIPRVDGMK